MTPIQAPADLPGIAQYIASLHATTGLAVQVIERTSLQVLARAPETQICSKCRCAGEPESKLGSCPAKLLAGKLGKPDGIKPFICPAGLACAVLPIPVSGEPQQFLYTGFVKLDGRPPRKLKAFAKEHGLNGKQFTDALKQLPLLSTDQFHNAVGLLSGYAAILDELEETKRSAKLVDKQPENQPQQESPALGDIIHGAELGTWDWNIRTGAVSFNQGWADMLGYTLDEIDPEVRGWEKLVHPEDMSEIQAKLQAHLSGETPQYESIHRLKTKTGEWRWILDKGRVLEWDADGKPVRACGTHTDVTEHRESRLRLQSAYAELEQYKDSLKRERDLFVDGPVVCFLWQATQNWPVEYVSNNVKSVLGYSVDQFLSGALEYSSLIHPEDLPRVIQEVSQGSTGGQAAFTHQPYRLKSDDGEYIWVADHTRVIRDAAGRITHYHGFIYDISDQVNSHLAVEKQAAELSLLNDELAATNEELEAQYAELESAADELAQAEERYRAFVSAVPDMLFHLNRDGVFKDFAGNENALLIPAGQFIDKPIETVLPQDVAETAKATIAQVLATGEARYFDYTLQLGQGEGAYTAIMVPYSGGDVLCIVRDISQRKAAQQAVAESEARLRTLINAMPDIICFKDGAGRWLVANDFDLDLFGLTGVDYRGKTDAELAQYSEFYRDAFLTCEATDERAWQAGGQSRGEEIIPRPDGTEQLFDVIKVPMFNDDGSRRGLIVVGRDITMRKSAEAALRASEQRYEMLVEKSPSGIALFDGEVVVYANRAAMDLVGADSLQHAQTRKGIDYIHPDRRESALERIMQLWNSGLDTKLLNTRFIKLDGTEIQVEVRASRVEYQGRRAIQLIFNDVTQRHQTEKRVRAHTRMLECLEQINSIITRSQNHEELLDNVLGAALEIFACDRAFLLSPCDQQTESWQIAAERTISEYPGILALHEPLPVDEVSRHYLREILDTSSLVTITRGLEQANQFYKAGWVEHLKIKSFMGMAIRPRNNQPWLFGIHQCSFDREWTAEERELFTEIAHRLADGLSSLLLWNDLRQSEERYRNVSETTMDVMGCMRLLENGALQLEWHAGSFEDIVGYSLSELDMQTGFIPITHPEDQARSLKLHEDMLREQTGFTAELRIIHKSGDTRWILKRTNCDPVPPVGCTARWFFAIEDITSRKRAEAALAERTAHLESVLRGASGFGIAVTDLDLKILYFNTEAERIYDYPASEVIGKCVPELHLLGKVPVERLEHAMEIVRAEGEYRYATSLALDGQTYFIDSRISGIINPDGELIGFVLISEDVTEQREAAQSINRLYTAVEQSAEVFLITDRDGMILYANPALEAVTGFAVTEVQDQPTSNLISSRHDADYFALIWDAMRAGETWQGQMWIRTKSGQEICGDSIISPVRDEAGNITSYVNIVRDITKQLEAEQHRAELEEQFRQSQKMEAVGRLAGGVAHDLNNMLTPILGYADLMIDEQPADGNLYELAEEIKRAGLRARDLVSQLLTFSRKRKPKLEVIDLNEILLGFQKLLRRTIRENIQIAYQLSRQELYVLADAHQLEQVMMNLAVNAQDAIPVSGMISISTGIAEFDHGDPEAPVPYTQGKFAFISMQDTGIGIPDDVKDKIFEPFFTTKPVSQGTGLGLATVYGIIERHNGFIQVDSKQSAGTEFKLFLPLSTHGVPQAGASTTARLELAGNESILVVEDEPQVRQLIVHALKRLGYKVFDFADPVACVCYIEDFGCQADLMVTDIIMPGLNGVELYRLAKRHNPALKAIFISGYSQEIMTEELQEELQVRLIHKPFIPAELTQAMREILDSEKETGD